MNTEADIIDRYHTLLQNAAPALPGLQQDWLRSQREFASQYFLQRGFPTRHEEEWRYTGLDPVLDQSWNLQVQPAVSPGSEDIEAHFLLDDAAARMVFINGRWHPELSSMDGLPDTVRMNGLRAVLERNPAELSGWLGQIADVTTSSFTAYNTALIEDGLWLHVPQNIRVEKPIEILYLSLGAGNAAAMQPRNLIVLEANSEAVLVEHYASLDDTACFTNNLSEVGIGEQARLEHLRLQDEHPAARHISSLFIRQGRASRYQGVMVSLGGLWSRTEYHNRMKEPEAHCDLVGLYVAGDGQLTDVHLDIEHAVPACRSREHFKGILLGKGRAVFDGRIQVAMEAQKTDAQLINDNLLLSRNAEIDTKPQLEIYADDVKCSHGTTVGQLDPAQLFYLRSRGIGRDESQRMLCAGFAFEVLEPCLVPAFCQRVERKLFQRLQTTVRVTDGE